MVRASGLLVLGVLSLAACSSDPFGGAEDITQVEARINKPTGTFRQSNSASVSSGYSSSSNYANNFDLAMLSGGGGSGGGITTKSLHLQTLHMANDAASLQGQPSFCSNFEENLANGQGSGSCSCPNGGSLQFRVNGQAQGTQSSAMVDARADVAAQACVVGNETINGTESVHVHGSEAANSLADITITAAIHLTATTPTVNEKVDADFALHNGSFDYSIGVNDGNVVVSATLTGTLTVRDRNTTWTCTSTAGSRTCSDNNGNTVTLNI
jgi:hypothetical protein